LPTEVASPATVVVATDLPTVVPVNITSEDQRVCVGIAEWTRMYYREFQRVGWSQEEALRLVEAMLKNGVR
jgi:hypothetical protein